MRVYIKIVLGLLLWGGIFWYFGQIWLDDKRLETCLNEVEKVVPDFLITQDRCIQTANKLEDDGNYGSAVWFYLLGGKIDKNIDKIEAKIDDNITINIGHTYLLQGNLKKAKHIYMDFLWFDKGDFLVNNQSMEDDFEILFKVYPEYTEQLKKGVKIWHELYTPLGKIAELESQYKAMEYSYGDENNSKILETILQLSEPYKDRPELNYKKHLKALAEHYFYSEKYFESISIYKIFLNESDAFPIEESEGDIYETISSIYMKMADVYDDSDFYRDAQFFAQQALVYRETKEVKNSSSLSETHYLLGQISLEKFEYQDALKEGLKAVELQKELLFDDKGKNTEVMLSMLNTYYKQVVESYQGLNEYRSALEFYGQYINFLENEYLDGFFIFLGNAYIQQGDYLLNSDNSASAIHYKKAIRLLKKALEDTWYVEDQQTYLHLLFSYSDHLKKTTDAGYFKEMDELAFFINKTFSKEDESSLYLNALTNEKMYDIYKNIDQQKANICHKKAIEQIKIVIKQTISPYAKEEYGYFLKEISSEIQESESNRTTQEI